MHTSPPLSSVARLEVRVAIVVGLVGDVPRAVAVKLEEERRRHRITGLGIAVHRVHLRVVEQLDPRDGNADLDRRDDGFDGAAYRLERADRRRHRLGQRMQPHGDVGDHPQRPFRADEQPRQVIAGR